MGNKYNVCNFIRFIPVIKLGIREKEEEEEEKEKGEEKEKRAQNEKKEAKSEVCREKKTEKPAKVKNHKFRWGGLRPEGGRFFTREPRGLRLR